MFKVNHRDTRMISFTSLWCLLMVTFEHISHFFPVLLLLTFDRHMFGGEVFLKFCQTPIIELFCENIKRLLTVANFHKKAAF